MKTQKSKKLFAFIITLMMFSVNLADAQRLHRGFMGFKNLKTGKNVALQQNNKPSINKDDPSILWQKTIGGSGADNHGAIRYIRGGYITCGSTNSTDGDFNVPANHDFDAYIMKLNHRGDIVWKYTYGGTAYDDFFDVIPTSDGGFIAIGETMSDDGDLTGNHGDLDVWVVKLDAKGKIQWQKNYGGSLEDFGGFIAETNAGYVFSAAAASSDGDLTSNHGDLDTWIVKISRSGTILSQHNYGGSGYEEPHAIYYNKADGTIIFSGHTMSGDGDVTNYHGGLDAWVVKLNISGNILWEKALGGSGDDYQNGFARTTDGNIVTAQASNSTDGNVSGNNGLEVAWVVKLNPVNGQIIWNKSFANPSELAAIGIIATADGGAAITGIYGNSSDSQTWDSMVLKIDKNGNQKWIKIFGGSKQEYSGFGAETPNGDIITSNNTESNDGDVKNAKGSGDTWIVLLDSQGHDFLEHLTDLTSLNNDNGITFSNYSNPTTNSTIISFTLPQSQNVSIKIYDLNGLLIKSLTDSTFEAGQHELDWNADKAGIYVMQIQSAEYSKTVKFVVSK